MKPITPHIPPNVVLNAYAQGYFPMGNSENPAETGWFNPPMRAVLPIDDLYINRKLRRFALTNPYQIRIDTHFMAVMEGCAQPTPARPDTWINPEIQAMFHALHLAGHAHSVEIWDGDELVGGLYGVALNSAFCGESMFSRVSGASKLALIHLCTRLSVGGFQLLDCQILNDHTAQFGAYEIPKAEYLRRLDLALQVPANFMALPVEAEKDAIVSFLKK